MIFAFAETTRPKLQNNKYFYKQIAHPKAYKEMVCQQLVSKNWHTKVIEVLKNHLLLRNTWFQI